MQLPEYIGKHQVLGLVGQGAGGIVYKVLCPESEKEVALKLLEQTMAGAVIDKLRFEREFRLASACDHPFLVKALSYDHSNGRPYYTMDLVDGVHFRKRFEKLSQGEELEAFKTVVTGFLEALIYIHERRIVHRDLKPENVLVTKNDEPRILDFGLAKPQYGEDSANLTNPGTVVGTIHYLSPEQLSSRPLDGRADLFSLGSMLYEVLCGQPPFSAEDPIGVFGQILSQEPPPLKLPTGFPDELAPLVMKLLEKEPSDRFQSADETLVRWRQVMYGDEESAVTRQVRLPEELYMPRFVGQENCLEAFDSIHKQEQGARVLLISGKAGAGKSRILEEFAARSKALGESHSGARGSAGESQPYELWIPSLRQAFKRPKPAMMPLRSVLSQLLPELGFSKSGATTKSHLFEAMSRVLRSQGGLIWLDDAHLADPASLEFLHYLARALAIGESLVVVATYNPEHPEKALNRTRDALLGTEFAVEQSLRNLSAEEVEIMVGSMLGGRLKEQSAILLHNETSGNPSHTSELVKAALSDNHLAFEEGHWRLDIPADGQLSHDVRDQLERQLQSIEKGDYEVLKLAAIIGFDFNFELLSQTSQLDKMELLERILRASAKGFLIESDAHSFRFGSRALQKVLYDSTPEAERPEKHLAVAKALETLTPRQHWVVDLARQYELAGQAGTAVTHLLAAGAEASRNFAHQDALDFYQRAIEVPAEIRGVGDDTVLEKIASAKQGLGLYKEAQTEFESLRTKAMATITKIRMGRKIAECQQMLGDFSGAHQNLTNSLGLMGVGSAKVDTSPDVVNPLRWVQKFFPKLRQNFSSDEMMSHQLHRILDRQLSNLFFLRPPNWTKEFSELAQLQRTVANTLGNADAEAQAQIFLGFVEMQQGRRDAAVRYWETAVNTASPMRDTPYKALLLRNTGLMFLLAGEPEKADKLCQQTKTISERLSDRAGMTQVHMVLCDLNLHWGRFEKAITHAKAMLETADNAGLPVFRALGWSYLARATARTESLAAAKDYLDTAQEIANELNLPYVDMMLYIARAWVFSDLDRFEDSLLAVEDGHKLCELIDALYFYRLTLRCGGIWTQVQMAQRGQKPKSEVRDALHAFQQDCSKLGFAQFVRYSEELLASLGSS